MKFHIHLKRTTDDKITLEVASANWRMHVSDIGHDAATAGVVFNVVLRLCRCIEEHLEED